MEVLGLSTMQANFVIATTMRDNVMLLRVFADSASWLE